VSASSLHDLHALQRKPEFSPSAYEKLWYESVDRDRAEKESEFHRRAHPQFYQVVLDAEWHMRSGENLLPGDVFEGLTKLKVKSEK